MAVLTPMRPAPELDQVVEFFGGWVLVSDAISHHLDTTCIVHHFDGCRVSNGKNVLRWGTLPELTAPVLKCGRCRAMGFN